MKSKQIKERVKELLATSKVSEVRVLKRNNYIEVYVMTRLVSYSFKQFSYYNNELLSVKGEIMFHDIIAMTKLFKGD